MSATIIQCQGWLNNALANCLHHVCRCLESIKTKKLRKHTEPNFSKHAAYVTIDTGNSGMMTHYTQSGIKPVILVTNVNLGKAHSSRYDCGFR